jgi:YVTN family beta-propeller protein
MPMPHVTPCSTLSRALVSYLGAILLASTATLARAAAGVAYVSNQNGDVTVIDLATMTPTGTISAGGKEPRGIGVTADGKMLVLANREGGAVAVIDRASGKLLRHVHVGENPEFVRTRGHLAFVTYEPTSTGGAPARPASGVASGPGKGDDDEAHTPAHVAIVDLDKGVVIQSIQGGLETEGVEFTPDGKDIVVANEADGTLTVHAIATGKLVKTVDLKAYGVRPRGIKLSPDGTTYVATLEFSNVFVVLDTGFKVITTVKTADAPYGLSFDRTGGRLFVAAARGKLLQVFDTGTWKSVKDVPIGARCWHFTFTPDDRSILLACGRSNEIVVVDTGTLEAVKHIPDDQLPWGIVTYPKSSGSLDQVESSR